MLKLPLLVYFAPFVLSVLLVGQTHAGGGPENVFLVANSADMTSLTIANHFANLRKVPATCVFEIDWPDAPLKTDIDTFRNRMLGPILKEIQRRRLTRQIDYIVYSSGFPYAAEFKSDLGNAQEKFTLGSITSLTFLHQLVMKRDTSYRGAVNHYARNIIANASGESQGFRAQYGIDAMGKRVERGGGHPQYYLSMMLGYTRGNQNNSLGEIMKYLLLGKQADGTQPDGTIYFVKNADIRSKVRHNPFAEVAAELIEMGVNAEVVEGSNSVVKCLPQRKKDVAGAMVGFYKFSWPSSGSTILPGAICEHFTSFGGDLAGTHTDKQSLLCDFLRFGAVAASGTVAEPYATAAKFPHPRMHIHYARGCSVAEAFYQSVLAPYQLIIVGDPLCQPWAVAPDVEVVGLDTKQALSGMQSFEVSAKSNTGLSIRNFDVFVDGVLLLRSTPGKPVKFDTAKLRNGYHELRVVAVEESKIETQGRAIVSFVSMNKGSETADVPSGVTSQVIPKSRSIRSSAIGYVKLQSRGAKELRLYKGRKLIGSMPGESGQIRFTAQDLGGGKSVLSPVAIPKAPGEKVIFGFPVEVKVGFGG